MDAFARVNFVAFVEAYYQHLKAKVNDPVFLNNPWVVDGTVKIGNLKSCGGVLNNSQRDMVNHIKNAMEPADNIISEFRRYNRPGLSVVVWIACDELLGEVEFDCRGKVDLLLTTKRAVVMGAEVKTSASAIRDA